MADLQIEPPEESEQESLFGKIFLRVGAVFLSALLGFALVILGYMIAIVMDLDLSVFIAYTSHYFVVSIVVWILIGSLTPLDYFQRIFEELKGVTAGRVVVFLLAIGTFVIVYWYLISFLIEILVSAFGTE
jgi:hypothetical protein